MEKNVEQDFLKELDVLQKKYNCRIIVDTNRLQLYPNEIPKIIVVKL